ncbi:MAG: efflux transporter outer membrane subunit [Bacteroidia bacterium]
MHLIYKRREGIDMKKRFVKLSGFHPWLGSISINSVSLIFLLLAAVTLNGCLVGGRYTPQSEANPIDTSYAYPHSEKKDTLELVKWFDLYKDEALNKLIKTALDSNRNLMIAASRVEQARERAGVVKSNLWPSIGYNGTAGTGKVGTDAQAIGAALDGNNFQMYGALSWELDLFGRVRHANKSAQAIFMSEIENRNGIQVALIGQTAELYFILRDLDNRLAIAERTLVSRKENTRLITERFNKGYVPELDKLQAEQQEATVEANIPEIKRQIIETENALRVIIGQNPGPIVRGLENNAQDLGPEIPAGIPSELLLRRPDIRSAEKIVEAQFNNIGVAKANMFPTISLTGILGFASPSLSTIISDNGFMAAGAGSIFGPIFEFSKNRSRKREQEYRLIEVTKGYEQTVLQAFADVDNSLYGYRSYNEQLEILNRQVAAATKALELTNARYDYGYTSYLEVIIQEDNLYSAELQRSFVLQKKLTSVVNLYRSLGGGW